MHMSKENKYEQDKNTPFDDVTHWVGNLPTKDTDSDERTNKRNLVRPLDTLLGDGHCSRSWSYWKVRRKW